MQAVQMDDFTERFGLIDENVHHKGASQYSTEDRRIVGGTKFFTYNINTEGNFDNMSSSVQLFNSGYDVFHECMKLYYLGPKPEVWVLIDGTPSDIMETRDLEVLMGEDFEFQHMLMDVHEQHYCIGELVVQYCNSKGFVAFNVDLNALEVVVPYMKEQEEKYVSKIFQ